MSPPARHEERLLLPMQSDVSATLSNGGQQLRRDGAGSPYAYTYSNSNSPTTGSESDLSCDEHDSCGDDVNFDGRGGRESHICPLLKKSNGTSKFKIPGMLRTSRRRCRFRSTFRLAACALIAPMLFLMLYVPLYPSLQTRNTALLDWGYNTSRNIADYVLPDNETNILAPRNVCRDKMFLLIVVCSSMQNFAIRQIIRDTWGNTTHFNYGMFAQLHSNMHGQYLDASQERLQFYSEYLNTPVNMTRVPATLPVRVYFLLGRSREDTNDTQARIHNEAAQYNDIIQEDFIDSYNNLTLKSVLALKFVTRRCMQRAAFIMKCDDDTFLNIPNLLHYLLGGTIPLYNDTFSLYNLQTYRVLSSTNRLNSTANFLVGHLFCTARPIATRSSKWYMPFYMYPGDKYPKYLSGSGYIMSVDVVPRLYDAALNTTLIHIEDVYLTGMCAEKIHLRRVHNALFGYTRAKDWCAFRGSIAQHEVKEEHMLDAYNFVTNPSLYCAPPAKYIARRLRKPDKCN